MILAEFTSTAGIRHRIERTSEGAIIDHASQDTTPLLDRNKAMATHNDGYTPSRELRRVASIPTSVRQKWIVEEGWDWMDFVHDPDIARKLRQKLNDPDYLWLRTAPGRV